MFETTKPVFIRLTSEGDGTLVVNVNHISYVNPHVTGCALVLNTFLRGEAVIVLESSDQVFDKIRWAIDEAYPPHTDDQGQAGP